MVASPNSFVTTRLNPRREQVKTAHLNQIYEVISYPRSLVHRVHKNIIWPESLIQPGHSVLPCHEPVATTLSPSALLELSLLRSRGPTTGQLPWAVQGSKTQ